MRSSKLILLAVFLNFIIGCGNDSYDPLWGPRLIHFEAEKALASISFMEASEKQAFIDGKPTPLDKLMHLATHDIVEIRHLVAVNPSADDALLYQLASDSSSGVRQAVASNHKTSEAVLNKLSKDDSQIVINEAMKNPNWSLDSLHNFYKEGVHVEAILRNPSVPTDILEKILIGEDQFLMAAIAENSAITNDLAIKLASKNSGLISMRLCTNPMVSKAILSLLSGNHDKRVRNCALHYMKIRYRSTEP